jgi:hypothetical protein
VERLTADVQKLPVLKHQKLLPPGYLNEPSNGFLAKIVHDVGVSLQDTDMVSHLFRNAQQFGGGLDIGGDAEVGAFEVNEPEQISGQRAQVGLFGAFSIRLSQSGMTSHDVG